MYFLQEFQGYSTDLLLWFDTFTFVTLRVDIAKYSQSENAAFNVDWDRRRRKRRNPSTAMKTPKENNFSRNCRICLFVLKSKKCRRLLWSTSTTTTSPTTTKTTTRTTAADESGDKKEEEDNELSEWIKTKKVKKKNKFAELWSQCCFDFATGSPLQSPTVTSLKFCDLKRQKNSFKERLSSKIIMWSNQQTNSIFIQEQFSVAFNSNVCSVRTLSDLFITLTPELSF